MPQNTPAKFQEQRRGASEQIPQVNQANISSLVTLNAPAKEENQRENDARGETGSRELLGHVQVFAGENERVADFARDQPPNDRVWVSAANHAVNQRAQWTKVVHHEHEVQIVAREAWWVYPWWFPWWSTRRRRTPNTFPSSCWLVRNGPHWSWWPRIPRRRKPRRARWNCSWWCTPRRLYWPASWVTWLGLRRIPCFSSISGSRAWSSNFCSLAGLERKRLRPKSKIAKKTEVEMVITNAAIQSSIIKINYSV